MDGESLGRGRQSVAHGVVAAVTDVRAVDVSEVTVGLGRGQQADILLLQYPNLIGVSIRPGPSWDIEQDNSHDQRHRP